jgi:hypothetical protein
MAKRISSREQVSKVNRTLEMRYIQSLELSGRAKH